MRLFATIGLVLFAHVAVALEMPQPTPKSLTVFSGSAAVEALGSTSSTMRVIDGMSEPHLVGRLSASGGTGNDIVVLVLTDADFVNWKNGHTLHPLFNSGQVTVTEPSVSLPGEGTYHLVLSNQFSAMTPKTVSGQLELRWMQLPSPEEIAAAQARNKAELERAQAAERNTLLVGLGAMLLIGAALGGMIVWAVSSRRSKRAG